VRSAAIVVSAGILAGCGSSPARDDAALAPRAGSVAAAVRDIRERTDVPVEVPRNLPPGTRVRSFAAQPGHAQLTLRLPARQGTLTLDYGDAEFDGCGPLHPRVVRIGRSPGILEYEQGYGTVVWPATPHRLRGRYGLSGRLPAPRLLSFARAMPPAKTSSPRRVRGC
jgi:hypothetical protein